MTVRTPSGSISSDRQWTDISKMVHYRFVVISRQGFVSSKSSSRRSVCSVVFTVSSSTKSSRSIWIFFFFNQSKELSISESQLWNGSLTSSISTTLEGIGSTRSNVLGGKFFNRLFGVDSQHGFDGFDCSKSPT